MRGLGCLALLVLCLLLSPGAIAADTGPSMSGNWVLSSPNPTGRWVTPKHDAVIQIAPCGQDLCGQIVGMVLGPEDPVPRDWAGATQCHLTIIRTGPAVAGVWSGSVIDPRDGSTYHAQITLDQEHHLKLRGYIGLPIFGRTQTWSAYDGAVATNCRLSGAG